MRSLSVVVILTLVVLAPTRVAAWGYEGHRIVATIARSYLTPATREKVDALLAADTDLTVPHTMIEAATWADAWRTHHNETSAWHFADIELDHRDLPEACFGFPAPSQPASAGPAKDCLVGRLNAFLTELRDPATAESERIIALKYVLHFMGDLHQPLHVADNHDKGGNCVLLSLGGPRTSTLHHYWDTAIIEGWGKDPSPIAARLRGEISRQQQRVWSRGDIRSWAWESYGVAKTAAYRVTAPSGCPQDPAPITLPVSYEEAAKTAIAQQLQRAGVRLATVLNSALH